MSSLSPSTKRQRAIEAVTESLRAWCGIRITELWLPAIEQALEELGGDGGFQQGVERAVSGDMAARKELVGLLATGESHFFRTNGHFLILAQHAQQLGEAGRSCNVLSAGCSTGEEVWSAAAVLADLAGDDRARGRVVGWDLMERRLEKARREVYTRWSHRHGFSSYERFFRQVGKERHVAPELRRTVRFKQVNLMAPSLPSEARFDIIFFRNVSIYWDMDAAAGVCARLASLLANDGILFVGPTDHVGLPASEFEQEIAGGVRVFRRCKEPMGRVPVVTAPRQPPRKPRATPSPRPATKPTARPIVSAPAPPRPSASTSLAPEGLDRIRELADRGDGESALLELTRLETKHPDPQPELMLWRGILELEAGRSEAAVEALRRCVFLVPEEPGYRHWLAAAFEAAGRTRDAAREVRNARAMTPGGSRVD